MYMLEGGISDFLTPDDVLKKVLTNPLCVHLIYCFLFGTRIQLS